jgi:hypothetical protein
MSNVLQFSLGMHDVNFGSTLATAGKAMLGTREKVEILRHSLDNMGGSFGALAGLSRLALDPMTIGFAAAFGAVELFNRGMENSERVMENFLKIAEPVEAIMRGILHARPSNTDEWVSWTEQIGKMTEHNADVKSLGDAFNDVFKGQDINAAEAANEQLAVEQKKIELLREQGKISQADAAKRIEALKDQAVLQKNLNETQGIKNEIARRQAELAHVNELANRSPSEQAALAKKISADNAVADLRKQIEDIPKAIAANQKVIETAKSNEKHGSVFSEGEWWNQSNDAQKRNQQLLASLAAAKNQFPGAVAAADAASEDLTTAKNYKSRSQELSHTIIPNLQNTLGVTKERQSKMTPFEMMMNMLDALMDGLTDKQKKFNPIANTFKGDVTSFEKMGFVMGSPSNPTQRMEDLLANIDRNTKPGQKPANINAPAEHGL